jgi:hypothetical protein
MDEAEAGLRQWHAVVALPSHATQARGDVLTRRRWVPVRVLV